jgi:hypothetical protein
MDGGKLPLFTIVKGKAVRSEWGLDMDPGRLDAAADTATGWEVTETMQQWLRFLRGLPEYEDMHESHVVIDCDAAHSWHGVLALADELGIRLHIIPPGLTDMLQPLDRAVFGALTAEYRAICRCDVLRREHNSMTLADFAALPLLAWGLVSGDANPPGLEVPLRCYRDAGEGAGGGPSGINRPGRLWEHCAFPRMEAPALSLPCRGPRPVCWGIVRGPFGTVRASPVSPMTHGRAGNSGFRTGFSLPSAAAPPLPPVDANPDSPVGWGAHAAALIALPSQVRHDAPTGMPPGAVPMPRPTCPFPLAWPSAR